VYDVTTKIQIWNASNSENVGATACDPIPSEGVTCHTEHWKGVSSIHVIIIYIFVEIFRNFLSQTRILVFRGESRCPGRINKSCSTSDARYSILVIIQVIMWKFRFSVVLQAQSNKGFSPIIYFIIERV
jgi:hypothetical protein